MRGEFAAIAILRVLRRGGIYAARCSRPDITNYRVNRTKGFPLGGGKLSPQMTDEGLPTGSFPLIRRVPRHLPPRGKAFPAGDEVTPPYIAILPQSFLPRPYPINVRARRALRIYYLLSFIFYLLSILPRRGTLVPDGAPIRNIPGNCNKKTALRFP